MKSPSMLCEIVLGYFRLFYEDITYQQLCAGKGCSADQSVNGAIFLSAVALTLLVVTGVFIWKGVDEGLNKKWRNLYLSVFLTTIVLLTLLAMLCEMRAKNG